jgi:aspartokinase
MFLKVEMVTIARTVEKLMEERPFIQEALSRGIINHAALAEELIPQIEKELKQKVKFSAVNLAIRRLSEKLSKTFVTQAKFDKESTNINVRSDLAEVTIYLSPAVQGIIKKIYEVEDFREGDLLTVTKGLHEVMIISSKKNLTRILKIIPSDLIKKTLTGLSSLTVNLNPESIETIGLFYVATRALNWDNINIIDVVSTYTEMTFVVREKDTTKAYDALKRLIN